MPRVSITDNGRPSTVLYEEEAGTLAFHWEFGGDDVVAIVLVSDTAAWNDPAHWVADRGWEVLRFVADEVIRQRAPGCTAVIDTDAGSIVIEQRTRPETPVPLRALQQFPVNTFRSLRMMLAAVVLGIAAVVACVFWFKNKVLVIDPGKGTPLGLSVRTDTHNATLIQTLEAYTPSPNRDHGKDTYSISLYLVPLDGSAPRLVPLVEGTSANSNGSMKILGSDGGTLWFDVNALGGVDLRTYELLPPAAIRDDPPNNLQGASASPFPPRPEAFLGAGFFIGPNGWLGVHSAAEVERQFKPKSWLRRVESAADVKELRRLYRGMLDPDTSDGHHRIVSMSPLGDAEYLNAAFLRMDDASEPIRLLGPDGALMIYTSTPGIKGTLIVARVDNSGRILWTADTGIDRFNLRQILPGQRSMAFVGTRLPVPDKVSEPLLVIVDNSTGAIITHSLWQ